MICNNTFNWLIHRHCWSGMNQREALSFGGGLWSLIFNIIVWLDMLLHHIKMIIWKKIGSLFDKKKSLIPFHICVLVKGALVPACYDLIFKDLSLKLFLHIANSLCPCPFKPAKLNTNIKHKTYRMFVDHFRVSQN